jgi:hypothetical protein
MAQSLEQLTQSLRDLDQQVIALGEALYETYQGYRQAIAQATQQQLILACYTLCTEAYPEKFLSLPTAQRQSVQTAIQDLTQQVQQELRQISHPFHSDEHGSAPSDASTADSTTDGDHEEMVGEILHLVSEARSKARSEARSEDLESEDLESDVFDLVEDLKELLEMDASTASAQSGQAQVPIERLTRWQERLEQNTLVQLRQISYATNQLLQRFSILPPGIPAPILAAAAQAEGADPFGQNPHLLRLVLEAMKPSPDDTPDTHGADHPRPRQRQRDQPKAILALVAVQIRLSEIEFRDSSVMTWRHKIRDLSKQLQTFQKEYQKKHRERTILEAQLAWRATWIQV